MNIWVAKVDKNLCVACGMCVMESPAVFFMDADGLASGVDNIPPEYLEDAMETVGDCPVGAISVIKSNLP